MDVNQGGAELNFVTIEGVTFATTVDSLLAVKYLVFDQKACTMPELVAGAQGQLGGPRSAAGQGAATRRPSTAATMTRPMKWDGR